MSSHDALMVASGITTVLDAVAIGDVRDGGDRLENLEKMINAIEETQKRGVNRAEHRLHLRCELPHHTTLPLFENWSSENRDAGVADGSLTGPAPVRQPRKIS